MRLLLAEDERDLADALEAMLKHNNYSVDVVNNGQDALDYLMLDENFPDGIDVEVVSFKSLKEAWDKAKLPSEREHVTPYVRNNSTIKGKELFKGSIYPSEGHYNNFRITVDETTDLEAVRCLIAKLGTEEPWESYIQYIQNNPKEFKNQTIIRNEGMKKSLKKELEIYYLTR